MEEALKSGYHHGNLRTDLLETGLRLARARGSAALVVREVAREVGVTSAAVYRHFPDLDHYKAEVSRAAREEITRLMIRTRDAVPAGRSRKAYLIARLRATGSAYIQFAIDEPELFETAYLPSRVQLELTEDDPSGWGVLNEALDDLLDAGLLDPALRKAAPFICWTSVHGLASLIVRSAVPGVSVDVARGIVLSGVLRALSLKA